MEPSHETENRTHAIDERYLEESLETLARRRFHRLPYQTGMPLQQLNPWSFKNPTSIVSGSTFFIVYALGMIPAGYLSWKCNANHGFNTGLKLLFGVFAALGSWNYLVAYLFYKSYTCNPERSVAYKKTNVAKLEELMSSI
jgi:hypothetical protein